MGIVLWEIAMRQLPYCTPELEALPVWDFRAAIVSGTRPQVPDAIDSNFVSLMTQCWQGNPHDRPKAAEALQRLQLLVQRYGVPEVRKRRHMADASEPLDEHSA